MELFSTLVYLIKVFIHHVSLASTVEHNAYKIQSRLWRKS